MTGPGTPTPSFSSMVGYERPGYPPPSLSSMVGYDQGYDRMSGGTNSHSITLWEPATHGHTLALSVTLCEPATHGHTLALSVTLWEPATHSLTLSHSCLHGPPYVVFMQASKAKRALLAPLQALSHGGGRNKDTVKKGPSIGRLRQAGGQADRLVVGSLYEGCKPVSLYHPPSPSAHPLTCLPALRPSCACLSARSPPPPAHLPACLPMTALPISSIYKP